ncbi:hypothetical protein ACSLPG_32775, partial [Escherichia coli]
MKNIAAQMVNFDCEQMRRIANNMPEQYDEKPQVQQVAQIINGVFSQLLATFPASLANRDQKLSWHAQRNSTHMSRWLRPSRSRIRRISLAHPAKFGFLAD